MTWPTTPVSTTNLDAGTDSPASARADLKTAVDNINAIAAEFGAVDTTGRTTNDVLAWDGSKWAPATPAAVPTQLDDLSDVNLTTPATDGQALVWSDSSSAWVAGTVSGGGGGGTEAYLDMTNLVVNTIESLKVVEFSEAWDGNNLITLTNSNQSFRFANAGTYMIETLGILATSNTASVDIDVKSGSSPTTTVVAGIATDGTITWNASSRRLWSASAIFTVSSTSTDYWLRHTNDTYSATFDTSVAVKRLKITKLA